MSLLLDPFFLFKLLSMFVIKKEAFGTSSSYHLVNTNTKEYVVIVPSCGAIANAWYVSTPNGLVNVIDGFVDDQDFKLNNGTSFKSNFLFPFPNRIRDGLYAFQHTRHQLPLNFPQENNTIHGLVYDQEFELLGTQEDIHEAKIVLQLDAKPFEGFPFTFCLKITYVFSKTGLQMTSEIVNTGKDEFPFGLGWHHYFKVGQLIDTAVFNFPSVSLLQVDQQMIPYGEITNYREFTLPKTISDTQLDTCFFLGDQGMVDLILEEKATGIKLALHYNTQDFPYLQVYTPPHRKTIAIEPMTCAPDVFNNHKGLKTLKPKEVFLSAFEVRVL